MLSIIHLQQKQFHLRHKNELQRKIVRKVYIPLCIQKYQIKIESFKYHLLTTEVTNRMLWSPQNQRPYSLLQVVRMLFSDRCKCDPKINTTHDFVAKMPHPYKFSLVFLGINYRDFLSSVSSVFSHWQIAKSRTDLTQALNSSQK